MVSPDTAPLKVDAIRLWLCEDKKNLMQAFKEIASCEQQMDIDNAESDDTGKY